jgi:hypothetical protein
MSFFPQSLIRWLQFFHIIGVRPAPSSRHRSAVWFALWPALLLCGCSAVKITYNNAPELSHWWLDSYLDFNDAQSTKVRADLTTLQTWHRQNELPLYTRTLEQLQRLMPADVTATQVCGVYADLKPRLQTLMDRTEPTITAMAPLLKPEQLDHLARQLDKRSKKWRDEWLDGTPAERNARRLKQLVDKAESFYGRLDEPQLAMLRAHVASSAFDAPRNDRESQRRHADTLQTLRQLQSGALSAAEAKTEVRTLLARTVDSPDAGYRAYADKLIQENCKVVAALHNSSTPAQRLKAIDTLKDYETDARTLMASRR